MKNSKAVGISAWVLYSLTLFAFLWFRIDPSLTGVIQESQFQLTSGYLLEHLNYPGGLTDYLASFLMMFFGSPAAASFIVVVLILSVTCLTWILLGNATKPSSRPLAPLVLIPSAMLLAVHCNYDHPLSSTLSLTLSLLFIDWYLQFRSRGVVARLTAFLFLGFLLYYITGGGFLLFAALCIIEEIAHNRQFLPEIVYGAIAGLGPYLAYKFLFLISMNDAYFHGFALGVHGYFPEHVPMYLVCFFPLAFIVELLRSRLPERNKSFLNSLLSPKTFSIVYGIIVCSMLAVAFFVSYQETSHVTLRINKDSQKGRWDAVLGIVQKKQAINFYTYAAAVQALYYTNHLTADIFTITHPFQAKGLFLFADNCPPEIQNDALLFLNRSDVYARLGLICNAEQWAYEAIGVCGETPRALKRAAEVHIIKGEIPAACLCLAVLKKMPLEKAWALQTECSIESGTSASIAQKDIPEHDFITYAPRDPSRDLVELLKQKPNAAMAGQYLIVSHLLTGDLSGFARQLQLSFPAHASTLPRNYEEALLLYTTIKPQESENIDYPIGPQTIGDFNLFNEQMQKCGSDAGMLSQKLVQFKNAYWFYYLFALQLQSRQAK